MSIPRITTNLLRELGASEDEVATFAEYWPGGAAVTGPTIGRLLWLRQGLDVDWLAVRVLTEDVWEEYDRIAQDAWEEYKRVTAPAYKEFKRTRAAVLARLLRDALRDRESEGP